MGSSARAANAMAYRKYGSRRVFPPGPESSRPVRRRSTTPSIRRRAWRAERSAALRSGECRKNVLQTARFPSAPWKVIAPARLDKSWTTNFGTPVVPDVSKIHSVCSLARRSGAPSARVGVQVTTHSTISAPGPAPGGSQTTASTDAVAMIGGTYSGGRSGGHSTIRPRDAIEFDQRQRSGQLILYCHQDRTSAQFVDPAAQSWSRA